MRKGWTLWWLGVIIGGMAWALWGGGAPEEGGAQGEARRIVSMAPSITEILFAVGAGEQVVGVSAFTQWPPEAAELVALGGHLDVSVEALVALRPDLVLTNGTLPGLEGERFGLRVEEVSFERFEDVLGAVTAIGGWVGRQEQAQALITKMRGELEAVRRQAPKQRLRVLLVVGRDAGQLRNVYCASGGSFLVHVLEAAGGVDALDVDAYWPQASLEQIVSADPDVIVELSPQQGAGEQDAARAVWSQALPSARAVAAGQVYVLTGGHLLIPGPRLGQVARELSRLLTEVTR